MQSVPKEKGLYAVSHLVDQLSNKNKDNYQMTLGAYTAFAEFFDKKNCFKLLSQDQVIRKIVGVCCQVNDNTLNLPYILNLLNSIVTQFIEQKREILRDQQDLKDWNNAFFKTLNIHFKDLCYNCLEILKQDDPIMHKGKNQYKN